MDRNLGIRLVILLLIPACSSIPGKKICESDFIEPVVPRDSEDLEREIADLRLEAAKHPDDPAIHRRLAVRYRLVGTPRSRLLSLEAIDRALELEPDNSINYVEKGLTMLARRFVGEAEKNFRTAVRIDGECFHGWYYLGRIKKRDYLTSMCFPDDLKAAIHYFKKAHRLRPHHRNTLFNLAFLHMFRSMYRTARRYAETALEQYPDDAKLHRLMGTIDMQQGKLDDADEQFAIAMTLMEEDELALYEDISVLLPKSDRELYETYPDTAKIESNRRFWIRNDPTPTSRRNERRLEHLKRAFLAQELLTDERLDLEGIETHRGRALISYGLPHKKYHSLGSGTDGPMVVWHYTFGPDSFYIYFQDEFLNGNYHFPIENRYYGELSVSTMERLPQRYDFPIDSREFEAPAGTAQIRGADGRTILMISVAVPDSLLERRRDTWNVSLVLFDQDLQRIFDHERAFRPDTLRAVSKPGGDFVVYHFEVPTFPIPLESNLAIELVQEGWRQRSVIRRAIRIRDYSGNRLGVSTLNLALPRSDGSCSMIPDPVPDYARDDKLCLTYEIYNLSLVNARARYRVTYSIKKAGEDKSGIRKTLSYITASIRGRSPDDEPYITSSIEQSSSERRVTDRFQIDIGALEPRRYLLVLTIDDLNGGKTVSEEREFRVTE
jgi:GWxTD domain-containing protein